MRRIWRRKSIQDLQQEAKADVGLRRTLGPLDLTAIGVGGIIGAGIFVLTGQAAATYAGPGIMISFVLAAIACAFAGLCYAEFAALIPVSGSAYTYSYATLGELFAWIIGWDLILEYSMTAAAVAVGWSGYVSSFLRTLGFQLPPELTAAPGTKLVFLTEDLIRQMNATLPPGWYQLGSYAADLGKIGVSPDSLHYATTLFNLPAFVVIALVTGLLVKGIRESAMFNWCIVVLKVAVILIFIVVGIFFIDASNWTPFIPANTGTFGEFGWSGVVRGAGVVFFAYLGFDAVSTTAQEVRNPQRDLPIGILASLVVCTVLYLLVALVLTGTVPYAKLNVADPIAVAVDSMGMPWVAALVKLGAIAGLTSVILVVLMAQPRILFTMARDGLLPGFFSALHPRFGTPYKTTILTGLFVAVVGSLVPIGVLGELVSIGTLAAFIMVCAAVLVLRYRHPDMHRPFKTPGVPMIPIMGIVCCLYLAAGLPLDTWARLIGWMVAGMVIYFGFGITRSRLNA